MSAGGKAVRPVVVGCRTTDFLPDYLQAFADYRPFGMIVFQEPCRAGPDAVRHVVAQFREATGRPHAPILIDQEGGAVNRLKPAFGHGWRAIPPAEVFAALAKRDLPAATRAAFLNAQLIAHDMRLLDLTVACAPVLDLFTEETFRGGQIDGLHAASGDLKNRMFGDDARIVATLGRAFADGLVDQGVVPMMKHIPGYGRVRADPHYAVTRVDAPLEDLDATDFAPFRALRDLPAAMTGHTTFTRIDADRSSTLSPRIIEIIRRQIGFTGILVTDAIEMAAVKPDAFPDGARDQFGMTLPRPGALADITREALAAGCDLVLHGDNSRDVAHTVETLEAAAPLADAALARLDGLLTPATPRPFDAAAAQRDLDRFLST